jgi:hypothetical protein
MLGTILLVILIVLIARRRRKRGTMERIKTPTRHQDKFDPGKDGFTDGNPQIGTASNQLEAVWFDGLQEEVANTIELAGITLAPPDVPWPQYHQLYDAIRAISTTVGDPRYVLKAGDTMTGPLTITAAGRADFIATNGRVVAGGASAGLRFQTTDDPSKGWLGTLSATLRGSIRPSGPGEISFLSAKPVMGSFLPGSSHVTAKSIAEVRRAASISRSAIRQTLTPGMVGFGTPKAVSRGCSAPGSATALPSTVLVMGVLSRRSFSVAIQPHPLRRRQRHTSTG